MRHIYKCNVAKVCCSINQPTHLSFSISLSIYICICVFHHSLLIESLLSKIKKSQRGKKKSRRLGFANSTHPQKKNMITKNIQKYTKNSNY